MNSVKNTIISPKNILFSHPIKDEYIIEANQYD